MPTATGTNTSPFQHYCPVHEQASQYMCITKPAAGEGDRNCKKMANYVPAAQFHPMFNQTITERRDYGAGGENRWSRQGPSNVVEGWHSGGAGIGMSYVRVGDRVIACGRGSEWGPGQRPRGTNYWDQAGARARRGYEWEPAKPRVQRGPTQEEIDAIVQRQIDATKDKVSDTTIFVVLSRAFVSLLSLCPHTLSLFNPLFASCLPSSLVMCVLLKSCWRRSQTFKPGLLP